MDSATREREIRLRDDLLITSLDEQEGIVLDVDSRSYFIVNETALFLLNVLQEHGGKASFSILKDTLLYEYDVPEAEAEPDLSDFLKGLDARGLASVI